LMTLIVHIYTGAIRYMAPEVGKGEPYNLKADVYSWSMLFWFIIKLEPPMGMCEFCHLSNFFSRGSIVTETHTVIIFI
jgi:hypothetical protein